MQTDKSSLLTERTNRILMEIYTDQYSSVAIESNGVLISLCERSFTTLMIIVLIEGIIIFRCSSPLAELLSVWV